MSSKCLPERAVLWSLIHLQVLPVSQNTQGLSLNFSDRLTPGLSVGHHARQIENFGNPSAVGFAVRLYFETHETLASHRACKPHLHQSACSIAIREMFQWNIRRALRSRLTPEARLAGRLLGMTGSAARSDGAILP